MTSTETVFGDEGESISYALDNVEYQIDLEDENASEVHADLDAFEAARWWCAPLIYGRSCSEVPQSQQRGPEAGGADVVVGPQP
jgi:hypothetical protein